jgi:hypothetical protein
MEKKVILLCFLLIGCTQRSKIPIPNTLEISLGRKYNSYVNTLNNVYNKDKASLQSFLRINYINDAAGYEHGYILFQLLKVVGDENFVANLKKLNKEEVDIVTRYIEAGIDANDKYKDEIKISYPKVAEIILSNTKP